MKKLSAFFSLYLLSVSVYSQPVDYSSWIGNINFQISTQTGWASTSTTVHQFPVLIQFNKDFFDFSLAEKNGDDIRFATDADVPLFFELEQWDSTSGLATVWVLMDSISANTSTNIRMYYGNPTAVTESNGAAVFDTAMGFSAVYHMNENPASGSLLDRTHNSFNGTPNGSMDSINLVEGVAGKAVYFDGLDDFFQLNPITDSYSNGLTVCGWVNPKSLRNWSRVIDVGNGPGQDVFFISVKEATSDLRWEIWNGTATTLDIVSYWETEKWIYSCGVWDGNTNMYVYKNGLEAGFLVTATPASLSDTSRNSAYIAKSNWGLDALFNGSIDELQISKVPRSPDWIGLAFQNQKPGQSLVSLPLQPNCTDSFYVPDTITVSEGQIASITGIANCALRIEWDRIENNNEIILPNMGLTLNLGTMPIVSADSIIQYRFKALLTNVWQSQDIVLVIKDDMPDPQFSLVSPLADGETWNGFDSLEVVVKVSNKSAIDSLPAPFDSIAINWNYYGTAAISRTITDSSIILTRGFSDGNIVVKACLDNGGNVNCDSLTYIIQLPPPLEIISPTTLDDLNAGVDFDITWNSTLTGSIFLQYSLDSGANWILIDFGLPNNGSYLWTVPNTPSLNAKVRISASTGGLNAESEYFVINQNNVSLLPDLESNLNFFVNGKLVYWQSDTPMYQKLFIHDTKGNSIAEINLLSNEVHLKSEGKKGHRYHGLYIGTFKTNSSTRTFKFFVK